MSEVKNETDLCNPGWQLREQVQLFPDKPAIISPKGKLSFYELEARSDAFAFLLSESGLRKGDKVIIMIRPSIDLYTIAMALFKCGAVPVVVDPGMGLKRMFENYRSVSARAFIGNSLTHMIRRCAPQYFQSIQIRIEIKNGRLVNEHRQSTIATRMAFAIAPTRRDDLCIINFTTGSTGPAKPVEATYGMLMATLSIIQTAFVQSSDDIDLVTVPFFGIVSILLGSTIVIPPMDPTKPGSVDPQKIIETIQRQKVTTLFASPALLAKIGPYGVAKKIKLESVCRMSSGGAPISVDNLTNIKSLLGPSRECYSSWGATEGLPLATISGSDILETYRDAIESGQGSPIGRILSPIDARLIRITDEELPHWDDALLVESETVGEIIVHGPNVSQSYHQSPAANAKHKILEASGGTHKIWHRTGDLAWQNEAGILFFTGRKAHAFPDAKGRLMHSVAVEGIANAHPKVRQSALVGVDSIAIICLELYEQNHPVNENKIKAEVLMLLRAQTATADIDTVLIHRRFPVDPRHNAKIERPLLSVWARHHIETDGKNQTAWKILPLMGWISIGAGMLMALPEGPWKILLWLLSVVSAIVNLIQIPRGMRVGAYHGYSAKESALRTLVFGAAWWRPLEPKVLR